MNELDGLGLRWDVASVDEVALVVEVAVVAWVALAREVDLVDLVV